MKNNKITNAYDEIVPNDFAKQRVWNKMTTEKQKRKSILPKFAAVAAVLAIMIAVYMVFPSSAGNSFTVQAYSFAQNTEGRAESVEFDFSTNQLMLSGVLDGRYMYIPIYLDVSGENIANVEFSVTSGFFARQYRDYNNVMFYYAPFENVIFFDATTDEANDYEEIHPIMFETEFEVLGNHITSEDMLEDSHSLLLAIPRHPADRSWIADSELLIDVVVTFNDGEIKSDAIRLSFHDSRGMTTSSVDLGIFGDFELRQISLDNAILIPESVQVLSKYDDPLGIWGVDVYIWEREGGTIYASSLIFRNPGDEERYSLVKIGDNVVMSLIRVDDSGNLVGMEYIIPGETAMPSYDTIRREMALMETEDGHRDITPRIDYYFWAECGSSWLLPVLARDIWNWVLDEYE